MNVDIKYKDVMIEALSDLMYKLSLEQEAFRGKPNTKQRKTLTKKQELVETLQHIISIAGS